MMKNYNRLFPALCMAASMNPVYAVSDTQHPDNRPNILLIFTDQQNINAMSAAGNPDLHTPHMDQLAADGVRFTKAYCTSPVSGPSRASMVTGFMAREVGVEWNDNSRLKPDVRTMGHLFEENGYHTVWAGKWHVPEIYPQQTNDRPFRKYGFEFLPFWNAPHREWLLGASTDPPLTDAVVGFLDRYPKEGQPFLLSVSYHNPHDICMFPRKEGWESENHSLLHIHPFGKYKLPYPMGIHPGELSNMPALPDNFPIPAIEPEFIKDKREKENSYGDEVKLAREFTEEEWRAYLFSYYRLTELVDQEIGKVISALKRNGLYDNTLIVFTSDHGDGIAAHQWAAKLSLYEESVQVPFILVEPGPAKHSRVDSTHLVSLADIVPTFCDYAGISSSQDFAGQSLKKIVETPEAEWRKYVICELADNPRDKTRKGRMVRSDNYKYNVYSTGLNNEQLFDLIHDPGETNNLAYNCNYAEILNKHRNMLEQWIHSRNDDFNLPGMDRVSDVGIYEIRCDNKINPVGVSTLSPRFSWKIASQSRGYKQAAYRLLVADDPEKLALDIGNIWDSGKCISETSILISYEGKALKSTTKYYWKVKNWDQQGNASAWSDINYFVMGMLHSEDWGNAQWITGEKESREMNLVPGIHAPLVQDAIGDRKTGMYKLPVFRKEFKTDKPVKQATLCISGLGHFDLFLNGEKVGDHFLDPGWTLYSKKALYVTFDVTDLLDERNVIGVMLGNGFYNVPRERYFKQLISFGAPKVKLSLQLMYEDGSHQQIVTDPSWKVTQSPITYSSIYGGEDYNAEKEPLGWKNIGFDDSSWHNSFPSSYSPALEAQISDPLKVIQELPAMKTFQNGRGNWIYDLGQNFSGIIRVKLQGKPGEEIVFRPGELLNPDGTINQSASGSPFYFKYTCRGDSLEIWQPQFTYYGFRYIEVEHTTSEEKNKDEQVRILELTGLHTTNSAGEAGRFSCSVPLFNKTYELIDWSVRSNLASILTDCPHREKLGWLEVAHLMQHAMQYRYDLSNFYIKVIGDIIDSQTEEGVVPSIAPEYVRFADGFEDSPEWGSAIVIIPWYIYRWYGDDRLIITYYPQMKKFMNYLATRADNFIISYGLGDWFDLGPNNPGYAQLTSNGVTATGIYYYNTLLMAQMAEICGYHEESDTYNQLGQSIKKRFNETFYNKEKRSYDRNSQTANSIALYFNLVEENNKEAVYCNLLEDIRTHNYALTSGDVGYRYLLRVLEGYGDSEVIYRMNTKYDVPGYGWQLAQGATALTESWQAYGFVSNNHCMLGHLMEWFFSGLGGIGQADHSVGYKTVHIAPQLVEGAVRVATSYTSPYGEIQSEWEKRSGNYYLKVVIPANSEAVVRLPVSSSAVVREGGVPIALSAGCKMVSTDQKGTTIRLGSGSYLFSFPESNKIN